VTTQHLLESKRPDVYQIDSSKRFWFVWAPSRSIPNHKHSTAELAATEAKRLATKHPGVQFIVLRATGIYETVLNPNLKYTSV
jgi:hypothetical protein